MENVRLHWRAVAFRMIAAEHLRRRIPGPAGATVLCSLQLMYTALPDNTTAGSWSKFRRRTAALSHPSDRAHCHCRSHFRANDGSPGRACRPAAQR